MTRIALFGGLGVLLGCSSPPQPKPMVAATVSAVEAVPVPQPEREAPRSYDSVGDSAQYLAEGLKTRERRRARLAEAGPVFWELAAAKKLEPALAADHLRLSSWSSELVVVERHPEHLRVVHQTQDVSVTFYMQRSLFHEVSRGSAQLLDADGQPYANGCGVTLSPGTVVKAARERAGFRRVELRGDRFVLRGVLPSDAIDWVYEVREGPRDRTAYDCTVTRPVLLREAPTGGRVVAELGKEGQSLCWLQGAPRDGAQKIEVVEEGVAMIGFVPAAVVTPVHGARYGRSHRARPPYSSHARYLHLWPDDALFPDGSGPQVARIRTRALRVMLLGKASGGKQRVRVGAGLLGSVTLAIDASTALAAEEKLSAWMGRVRYEKVVVKGGGDIVTVNKELERDRRGVTRCYDRALRTMPKASFQYDVELHYSPDRPEPLLKAVGASHDGLESCLSIWLRNDTASLHGARAMFRLALSPSDRLD